MGKGKFANIGAIMHAMKDTTPEVAKSINEYLSKNTKTIGNIATKVIKALPKK